MISADQAPRQHQTIEQVVTIIAAMVDSESDYSLTAYFDKGAKKGGAQVSGSQGPSTSMKKAPVAGNPKNQKLQMANRLLEA